VSQLAKAKPAGAEKAVITSGTTAQAATVMQLDFGKLATSDFRRALFLFYHHGRFGQDVNLLCS
jgi:hypothetical protein